MSVTFREALKVWTRIGLLSFGGPAGQIALMHKILVDEKKGVLTVPVQCVVEQAGKLYCWRESPHGFEKTEIKLGTGDEGKEEPEARTPERLEAFAEGNDLERIDETDCRDEPGQERASDLPRTDAGIRRHASSFRTRRAFS